MKAGLNLIRGEHIKKNRISPRFPTNLTIEDNVNGKTNLIKYSENIYGASKEFRAWWLPSLTLYRRSADRFI